MSKKTIIILIISVILLALVFGFFVLKQLKPEVKEPAISLTEESIVEEKEEKEEEPVVSVEKKEPLDLAEEKPLVGVIDCGEMHPDNLEDQEKIKECWDLRFKNCEPAKIIFTIDMGPLGGLISYYYEIIGPDNNLCKVKSRFLKNPNPDWIGKEMICKYDNSEDFEAAAQDFIGKCSGPLYELMTEEMQLHSDPNCILKSNITKINLMKGVGSSITASNFKGTENQVIWRVVDTDIATVSPSSGKTTMIKSLDVGSTEIIATDTAIGPDCFVSISLTVSQ